ncbi:hypothetical protein OK18_00905 [Chryseobacterium gallinarum]|uniref:Uncharacterized protein n=1 Tax=Chryseobacterium gallinarum TaxID=1324352 RepID=A0A0G3M2X8_CHRGL|nr:hypothetical protein OK18_00905 [Chryseobacterium gallinarum]
MHICGFKLFFLKTQRFKGNNGYFKEAKKRDFVADEALYLFVYLVRINEIDSTLYSLEIIRYEYKIFAFIKPLKILATNSRIFYPFVH